MYPRFGKDLMKKNQLCAIALKKRKRIWKVLLKMVGIATSQSLLRFYFIAMTPTVPVLLQNKISFSNKHIL